MRKTCSLLFSVAYLAFSAIAIPATRNDDGWVSLNQPWSSTPPGFTLKSVASPNQILNLRIGLHSTGRDDLEKALYAMSTPGNSEYGKHYTADQIHAHMAPSADAVNAVNAWLSKYGLTSQPGTKAGDWLHVNVSVSQAETMLRAKYSVYTHTSTGKNIVRTLAYSVPTDVAPFIAAVSPTNSFGMGTGAHYKALPVSPTGSELEVRDPIANSIDSSCLANATLSCIAEIYGIPRVPFEGSKTRLAVAGFGEAFAQFKDLSLLLAKYRPDLRSPPNFTVVSVAGGLNTQFSQLKDATDATTEANLDIQLTAGLSNGLDISFFSVGNDDSFGGAMLDLVVGVKNAVPLPSVLSISYGSDEADIMPDLARKVCDGFMVLGAMGVSVLVSSGDHGVAGRGEPSVNDPSTSDNHICTGTVFRADFPASCPFVTTVGATVISPAGETAVSSFPSGGGFSNTFARPSYQASAVQAFLTRQGTTNSGKFNVTGRGYPDVSAVGDNIPEFLVGKEISEGGTSASTPLFSSIIALMNDRLIASGGVSLGFLNPFLYANPDILTDMTSGDNRGCGTLGFSALKGWDPLTGLGTPTFDNLLAAASLAQGLGKATNHPTEAISENIGAIGEAPASTSPSNGISYIGFVVAGVVVFIVIVAIAIVLFRRQRARSARKAARSASLFGGSEYRPLSDPAPPATAVGIMGERGDNVALLATRDR